MCDEIKQIEETFKIISCRPSTFPLRSNLFRVNLNLLWNNSSQVNLKLIILMSIV